MYSDIQADAYVSDILDSSPLACVLWDADSTPLKCNKAAVVLFGVSGKQEYLARFKALSPAFQANGRSSEELGREHFLTALETGRHRFFWTHRTSSGEPLPAEVSLTRLSTDGKEFVIGYIQDLREIEIAKAARLTADRRMRTMLDLAPLCCSFWDEQCKIVDCNQEAARQFDLESKKQYVNRFFELSPEFQPDGRPSKETALGYLKAALKTGYQRFFWMHQKLNGEPIPSEVTLVRARHSEGIILASYTRDLREAEAADKARLAADRRIRAMLDLAPFCCSFWDEHGVITDCNEEAARQFGLDSKADYIKRFHELSPTFQPDGRTSKESSLEYIKTALKTGYQRFFWQHQKLNGEQIPSEVTLVRGRDSDGLILAAYTRDLRESEYVETARRMADRRMRTMLDLAPFCCFFWNENFAVMECNQETLRQFGPIEKREFLNRFHEFSPPVQPDGRPSKETAFKYLRATLETGYQRFFWMHQKLNGEPIPSEVTLVRARHSEGLIVACYTRDLREAEAAEAERRKADERIRMMLDSSPLACNFWDSNCTAIECNAAAVRLFGFNDKSEYLSNFFKLSPEFQPGGQPSTELAVAKIREAFETGYLRVEWLHQSIDGVLIPAEITLVRVRYGEEHIVLSYARDLREHKAMLAEIEAYEEDLQQALEAAKDNARAKSEFLTNISHELRTPMNAILGMSRLLEQTELNSRQRWLLKNSLDSAELLLRLIDDTLNYSAILDGKLTLEQVPFALADVARELEEMVRKDAEAKKLELSIETAADLPSQCIGDPLRLKQVLLHLTGNAVKFTQAGRIRIEFGVQSQASGSFVLRAAVHDSGIGMSCGQIERLFTAFSQADSTYSRKYGGAGLGLTLCKSLISMMQGNIWCDSTPGKGTSFYFTVSLALPEKGGGPDQVDESTRDARLAGTRILLAEDNTINQIIAVELLESKGMHVDVASNGLEALELLAKAEYDLVLMDIQMPEMDGITATTQIRAQEKYRDLPILALTSHARESDRELSLSSKMNAHLTKPIDQEALYDALYAWLPDKPRA